MDECTKNIDFVVLDKLVTHYRRAIENSRNADWIADERVQYLRKAISIRECSAEHIIKNWCNHRK